MHLRLCVDFLGLLLLLNSFDRNVEQMISIALDFLLQEVCNIIYKLLNLCTLLKPGKLVS